MRGFRLQFCINCLATASYGRGSVTGRGLVAARGSETARLSLTVVRYVSALRQVVGHDLLAVDPQHAPRDGEILLEVFFLGREQLFRGPEINARG